ncbi:MAG TPA: response regulator [Chitinophagaceae bacterium]|nr:response regulator [Chitinophagaceae bacterium]
MENTIEIVLIEDNLFEAELAIKALEKNNLANRLLHIDDGEEALQFIFCKGKYKNRNCIQPKLILLDLKLPKVDGLQILKEIKSDPATKSIPVVILTSSQEERDIVESYQLGANSYLVKPVNFESFAKAIADLGFYWLLLNQTEVKSTNF